MSCGRGKERLPLFVDEALPFAEQREIEEHLASCPDCRIETDRLISNRRFLEERLSLLRGRVEPDLSALATTPAPAPVSPPKREPEGPALTRRPIAMALPVALLVLALSGAIWWLTTAGKDDPEEREETRRTAPAVVRRDSESPPSSSPPPDPRATIPKAEPLAQPPSREWKPVPVRSGIVQLLPRLAGTPSQSILDRAWEALAESPDDLRPLLDALSTTEAPEKQIILILALGGAADRPEARNKLTELLTSSPLPSHRAAAAAALAHGGEPTAGTIAVGEYHVRPRVIEDPGLRGQLLTAAEMERDPKVVLTIVKALGPSQELDETITSRLVELAGSPEETVRRGAIEAIRLGRPRDTGVLATLIRTADIPAGERAVLVPVYVEADSASGIGRATELLREDLPEAVHVAVLDHLATRAGEGADTLAVEVARDSARPDPVRRAALRTIAAGMDEEALATLEQIAREGGEASLADAAREMASVLERELARRKEAEAPENR